MRLFHCLLTASLGLGLVTGAMAANDAAPNDAEITIGMVLPMSGPFAGHGHQLENGVRLFLAERGDEVAGHKVRVIIKDDTGIAPSVSKRQAQELLIRDKVDLLAGFGMTPSAFAVAPLANETKTPMVVMNAATSSITEQSPYILRTSFTLPQVTAPIATWAHKEGIKTVYTMAADYGPGHDAEKQFVAEFTAHGGTIVNSVRTPTQNPDFAPFLQKAKDAKPDAVFLFVPAGEQGVAAIKAYKERGLDTAGIRLIATGDLNSEDVIDAIGDAALGLVTSFHYSDAHDSPENKAFVAAYRKMFNERPNFWSVGGYDGMELIYKTLEKTQGNTDGDTFMAAAKGMAWTSPRGPVQIDPDTRDIIQNVYIRKEEKVNGELKNVEFDVIEAVKDPGKTSAKQ